ncbi:MAG: response regulator [Deltaproteobacteria bacterium]|nr:response regulator [Deltaproteobacteria bacterium]
MLPTDQDLLATFREEVAEALDEFHQLLDALALKPSHGELRNRLQGAFRIVHNVKGAARAVGHGTTELLAHALEDALVPLRDAVQQPTAEFLAELRRGATLIQGLTDGNPVEDAALDLVQRVAERRASTSPVQPAPASGATPAAEPAPAEPAAGARALVRVDTDRLDRLMGFGGEYLALLSQRTTSHARWEGLAESFQDALKGMPEPSRRALAPVARQLDALVQLDRKQLRHLGQLTGSFGTAIKTLRMQPLARVVPLWRRIVFEIAEQVNKQVQFTADVGDLEIDRQILDGMRDPLMHLLRNALDHGVEPPAERQAAGKSPTAAVTVRARSVGTQLEILISDDGRGVDLTAVARRAVERGLLDASAASTADRALLVGLLFAPGFSTATQVSRLSGRGVGLDVVRSRVTEFGGTVTVEPGPGGCGTTVRLTLPASLVSTKGLLVEAGQEQYALPLAAIARTTRVPAERVSRANGATVVERDGREPLPLRWLSSVMDAPRGPDPALLVVVQVTDGHRELGLVVDRLLGEAEFVTKRLPWNVGRVPGIAGAVVLGDGTVAGVVDVGHLFSAGARETSGDAPKLPEARSSRSILVVDDSHTSRTLMRNILNAAGYQVAVAVNGAEALAALETGSYDLVVSDVEMPRLDGIELTRTLRGRDATRALPVILVTSLERPEDVAAGAAAGADEYIIKGRFEQRSLLDAVRRLL